MSDAIRIGALVRPGDPRSAVSTTVARDGITAGLVRLRVMVYSLRRRVLLGLTAALRNLLTTPAPVGVALCMPEPRPMCSQRLRAAVAPVRGSPTSGYALDTEGRPPDD